MDTEGYKKIDEAAQKTKNAVETKSWRVATMLWSNAEAVINEVTDNIDFYNILTKMEASGMRSLVARIRSKPFLRGKIVLYIMCIIHCTVEFLTFCYYSNISEYATFNEVSLSRLMNGPVKKALQLPVNHGDQSDLVFEKLQEDFMKPVVNIGINRSKLYSGLFFLNRINF